ncbi:MAG: hypothetical protein WCZ90_12520 [Melioribacteraceae bacterium]
MGKLKLNLDEIKVESFEVQNNSKTNGTVLGQEISYARTCFPMCEDTVEVGSCVTICNTADATCPDTCTATCEESCNGSCVITYVSCCDICTDFEFCMY